MYAPIYSYGLGNSFNQNAGSSQQAQVAAQPAHQQTGQQHQLHQQLPHQQHVLFSPQQYLDSAGPQLSPYGSMGNVGSMGIGSNNGMTHLGSGNAIPSYQTPYSSSPYNTDSAMPTSNLMSNFMSNSNTPPAYAMSVSSSSPQHHTARLQSSSNSSTPNHVGARVSPFLSAQHGTSPNSTTSQPQFSTPQNLNQQLPAPINTQQSQSAQNNAPLTPNLSAVFQGGLGKLSSTTPLSPESEVREKERVNILLVINKELLLEVMRLQAAQNDSKEDSYTGTQDVGDKEKGKNPTSSRYYFECMRRLQANLAYLAARADRNKSYTHTPAHPQIMSAPTLSPKTAQNRLAPNKFPGLNGLKEQESRDNDFEGDRNEIIKEYYKRLQALFPGVDPRKDSLTNPVGRLQQAALHQQTHKPGVVDSTTQQRMQPDLYRQKLIHQQQASHQSQLQ